MATAKAITVQTFTADAAFERVKPLLDRLRDDTKAAANLVAKEYDALPKLEKDDFAAKIKTRYGWSQKRLSTFAYIGRKFPKQKLLLAEAGIHQIDETNTEVLGQIVRMSDDQLRSAAKAGLFKDDVSKRDIIKFRKTGQLPKSKITAKPQTDLQKMRAAMVVAEDYITKASLKIGVITALMEDSGVTDAKGREVRALVKSFEKLCTKMATANPTTSKRAFAILRGEV